MKKQKKKKQTHIPKSKKKKHQETFVPCPISEEHLKKYGEEFLDICFNSERQEEFNAVVALAEEHQDEDKEIKFYFLAHEIMRYRQLIRGDTTMCDAEKIIWKKYGDILFKYFIIFKEKNS